MRRLVLAVLAVAPLLACPPSRAAGRRQAALVGHEQVASFGGRSFSSPSAREACPGPKTWNVSTFSAGHSVVPAVPCPHRRVKMQGEDAAVGAARGWACLHQPPEFGKMATNRSGLNR